MTYVGSEEPDQPHICRSSLISVHCLTFYQVQSNLSGLNTNGSFAIANLNSFFSPYKILRIAQENKYLSKFSYFIMKLFLCVIRIASLRQS